jgi:hypothetical protein
MCVILVVAAAFSGCGSDSKKVVTTTGAAAAPSNRSSLIVAPASVGVVKAVNLQGRFAVVVFPLGQVPSADTRLVVYRGDAKVGEVKITGPTQENVTVGDIVLGSVQENDEVRSN